MPEIVVSCPRRLVVAASLLLVPSLFGQEARAQACESIVVQAEGFLYSDGIQTQPTTDAGGGLNVGWIDDGDWLSYLVPLQGPGTYEVAYRVASDVGSGGVLALETDAGATHLGTIDAPYTGGWQSWTTISHVVDIPHGGERSLGLAAVRGGFNVNWISFTKTSCGAPDAAITAQTAASEMGRGVNLGQMFENTQHPRTFDAARAKIDAYYDRGFRNLRIPVTWTDLVGGDRLVYDENVGEVDRAHPRLAEIERIVDHALSKPGLYVVLNAHHERALKTHSRHWVLERLWEDISDIFRDRSHRLLFEILNEPHRDDASRSPMPPEDLRVMTGKAYSRIRAVDPERIIIIGGNQWFGHAEMAQVWPHLDDVGGGHDAYLMATFHHYSPWSFCGNDQGDYADGWSSTDLITPMDVMRSWADGIGGGMPVYIGEWGVGWGSRYADMQCNNIRLWYQMFDHDIAVPKGMPTAVWDDGGWFKIFDHGTNAFANNLVDCISGSCDWTTGDRFNDACD